MHILLNDLNIFKMHKVQTKLCIACSMYSNSKILYDIKHGVCVCVRARERGITMVQYAYTSVISSPSRYQIQSTHSNKVYCICYPKINSCVKDFCQRLKYTILIQPNGIRSIYECYL